MVKETKIQKESNYVKEPKTDEDKYCEIKNMVKQINQITLQKMEQKEPGDNIYIFKIGTGKLLTCRKCPISTGCK